MEMISIIRFDKQSRAGSIRARLMFRFEGKHPRGTIEFYKVQRIDLLWINGLFNVSTNILSRRFDVFA